MALVEFNLTFDDAEVSARLSGLVARMSNTEPLLKAIGEHFVVRAGDSFAGEEDPDGRPWTPLRQTTISRREKAGQLPLTVLRSNSNGKSGSSLAGSINWELTGSDGVRIGSPVIYAAVHQFGARKGSLGAYWWTTEKGTTVEGSSPWGDIPARPFLGVGHLDGPAIIEMAEAWLGDD